MDQFVIEGGIPLHGTVIPEGNKNAALPVLAATLLTDEPVVLHRVPDIADVRVMRHLLESLGVSVADLGGNSWRLQARDVRPADLSADLCKQIRASILLAGPMSARCGGVRLFPPGGDVIGRRRLDTHFLALEALGVSVSYDGQFNFRAEGRLRGADILLDEASVTATENAIMAAVLAEGTTVLRNAASEPHVQDLCRFLNGLGAQIENIGSNTLVIHGVERLHGGEFTIGADYLEVISYVGAAVVTGGSLRVKDADPQHLPMIQTVFRRLGVVWQVEGSDLVVPQDQPRAIVPDFGGAIPEIKTNIWPAFPTDLISIAITVATQMEGTVLFHDWMYSGRMFFTDKLAGMGARIILCDPYRCMVQGATPLYAETLESPDIRAGMALLLAALAANGQSVIRNVRQIDRGYARVEEKLAALGAHIQRVRD
jgi:UDP-N-acetylglucosamine 1-carboxyvinyltransferase